MENMEIYNKYREVPQNALKPFDNGRFKGTDINTMWRIKCLTETFGICGIGWYYDLVRTWVEKTTNEEQYAFAEIKLYIKVDGEWSKGISGTGGNKLAKFNKNGELVVSDEAFKMAVTDAFGVACKYLGIGADVYWDNDRTKYTDDTPPKPKKEVQEVKTSSFKITKEQINLLLKVYTGDNLLKLLQFNNIDKIEDMTFNKADELIKKVYKEK